MVLRQFLACCRLLLRTSLRFFCFFLFLCFCSLVWFDSFGFAHFLCLAKFSVRLVGPYSSVRAYLVAIWLSRVPFRSACVAWLVSHRLGFISPYCLVGVVAPLYRFINRSACLARYRLILGRYLS